MMKALPQVLGPTELSNSFLGNLGQRLLTAAFGTATTSLTNHPRSAFERFADIPR